MDLYSSMAEDLIIDLDTIMELDAFYQKKPHGYLARAVRSHDHGPLGPVVDCNFTYLDIALGFIPEQYRFSLEDIHTPRLSPEPEPLDEFRPGRRDELESQSLSQLVPWARDEVECEMLGPVIESSSDSEDVKESEEDWKSALMGMIRQMMFVSGETSEASVETTTIIEEVVHTQVTEIVSL